MHIFKAFDSCFPITPPNLSTIAHFLIALSLGIQKF